MKKIKDSVERAIKNVRSSLNGTITSVKKDDKTIYTRFSEDEEIRDISIMTPYGFFSLPNNGDTAQVIFNNSAKKASVVGVEHSNIPVDLDVGESVVYNPSGGNYIHLKNNGDIEISSPTNIFIKSPNIEMTGTTITANGEDLTTDLV